MCGASEDRAGAVVHQDEIADPNRQLTIRVNRVLHANARINAFLLGLFHRRFGRVHLAAFFNEISEFRVARDQLFRNRVIGCHGNKRRAAHRVRAGGIADNRVAAIFAVKRDFDPAGFSDPVGLHQFDLGRPVIEAVQRSEQFFGIVGDLKEPLHQLATLNLCTRAPAFSVDHLLVGEHGHINRVPVHDSFLTVNQTLSEKIDKQCLLLAVIFRVTGRELA